MAPKRRPKRDRFGGEDPFALWRCHALHRQHDAAVEEDVPAELLHLATDCQGTQPAA